MPPSKAVSRALMKYPRLTDGSSYCSYPSFLREAFRLSKPVALLTVTKAEVDTEFATQVRQSLAHDDGLSQRLIDEATNKTSNQLWETLRSDLAKRNPRQVPTGIDLQAVKDIKLAAVGWDPRNRRRPNDSLSVQRYEDFARKTESLNRETEFDKALMDDAFRLAVSRITNQSTKGV
ncbi:hypothetical protein M409DRAFT_26827 [Zasmidium cellare ATCC 36951]|uniref:Uncharacterized protein n=1 Tax=Zasmidium cellare ATCC 36951 TaxID=1080233 RepID=A0A6A6C9R2_ZASCE|nr:uncharacterized protein M409DRAFT_26827 [Zasmidium cellare ATCC 36951]KAF2162978.1 hypothetical protein M409DRAFT_26827 [Zasmidium cellare ATCC 36951]